MLCNMAGFDWLQFSFPVNVGLLLFSEKKAWFVVALSSAQAVKEPIMKNKTAIQNQNYMTTLFYVLYQRTVESRNCRAKLTGVLGP